MSFSVTGSLCFFLCHTFRDLIRLRRFDPETPIEETVGEVVF
jgi:hypothetical protein